MHCSKQSGPIPSINHWCSKQKRPACSTTAACRVAITRRNTGVIIRADTTLNFYPPTPLSHVLDSKFSLQRLPFSDFYTSAPTRPPTCTYPQPLTLRDQNSNKKPLIIYFSSKYKIYACMLQDYRPARAPCILLIYTIRCNRPPRLDPGPAGLITRLYSVISASFRLTSQCISCIGQGRFTRRQACSHERFSDFVHFSKRAASLGGLHRFRRNHSFLPRVLVVVYRC